MQLSMDLFHHNHHNMNVCDLCGKEFDINEDLITHARHVHHQPILKYHECGKEFVSIFLGIALLIIGIEIIAVGWTGRRMQITYAGGRKINFKI